MTSRQPWEPADDALDQFLFASLLSRRQPDAHDAMRRALERGVDWQEFRHRVARQRVAPLIYAAIKQRNLLPASIEAELREAYYFNAARNATMFAQLDDVLQTLARAGISSLVLKGPALAVVVYDNIALRPMSDLDILIPRADAAAALRALRATGYRPGHPEVRAGATLEHENEIILLSDDGADVAIELHWNLLDSAYHQRLLTTDWLWQTAVPATLWRRRAAILGPEAQALHLCSHLMLHHQGRGLLWWCDIAEVLHHYQKALDWDFLLAQARAFDLVIPLRLTLLHLADVWQAPVPPEVQQRLRSLPASPAEEQVYGRLSAAFRPVAQRFWSDLAGMQGWRRRWRFLWQNLFPHPAYMRQRYGVRNHLFLPFSYPYRWLIGLTGLFH